MSSQNPSISAASSLLHDIAQQSYPAGALYVVATPLGNAGDIGMRALHVLGLADIVACEDTRNTGALLSRYGLSKRLIAAHRHNEREAAEKLVTALRAGERVALVSDAGTPGISDPGGRIVDAVVQAGLQVIPIPGPCAAAAALSVAGFTEDAFHFAGFLPARAGQRSEVLRVLRPLHATLVFYEAPHRIAETVDALCGAFEPFRRIVFARELSKLFEEIHRCPLGEAAAWLAADANRHKGEFVLLVEGAPESGDEDWSEADRVLKILLAQCPVSQAAAMAAEITGLKKNALYDRALKLKEAPQRE